jgi:hypothetical protein
MIVREIAPCQDRFLVGRSEGATQSADVSPSERAGMV